jgi:predicted transcriptional regulator
MPKTARDVPPPLELECLNALWTLGEGNVKQVREIVTARRPLAYTTIMTVLDRLVRKGKLARRKVGRAFQYAPTESRDSMRQAAIRELLDGFFDGSRQELLAYLSDAPRESDAPPVRPGAAEAESRIDTVLL